MEHSEINCPVCSGEMECLVSSLKVYHCEECKTVGQVLPGGVVSQINNLLEKNLLGDDRVRAAQSAPHINTVENFVDIYSMTTRTFRNDMEVSSLRLWKLLTKIENRITVGIAKLAETVLVDDSAKEAMDALIEARSMVSLDKSSTLGISVKNKDMSAKG